MTKLSEDKMQSAVARIHQLIDVARYIEHHAESKLTLIQLGDVLVFRLPDCNVHLKKRLACLPSNIKMP